MSPFTGYSLLLLAFLFSCSPGKNPYDARTLSKNLTVPENLKLLDAWLADRESQFPGMRAEANKLIVWNNPDQKQKTPVALVYIHGYTASRKEIDPAPRLLARQMGANLYYTRLTGHGLGPEGHRDVTVEDWLTDSLEALEIGSRLGNKVVLLSTSTGGTLTSWLCQSSYAPRIAAAIMVSPNLTPHDFSTEFLLWPMGELLLKIFIGDHRGFTPHNDYKARYWDTRINSHSLIPMMKLVNLVRKGNFNWNVPTLVFYDLADRVVNEEVTVKLLSHQPAIQLREVKNSQDPDHHILVGDAESPGFTTIYVQESFQFLEKSLK